MGTVTFDIWSVLILSAIAIGAGAAMWALIPRWHGIPPTSSRPKWIRKALDTVDLQPGQIVYDLGSGNGVVLTIAAKEYGAQAVGYEIEPLHCVAAWLRALFSGVIGHVSVRRRDLYMANVEQADVVFVHLNPTIVENLRVSLPAKLRPGTHIVSLDFPFDGWEPSHMDIGYLIFTYKMPPQPGSLESFLRKELDTVQPS